MTTSPVPERAHHVRHLLLGLVLAIPLGWLVAYLEMGWPVEDLGIPGRYLSSVWFGVLYLVVEGLVLILLALLGGRYARWLFAGVGALWLLPLALVITVSDSLRDEFSRVVAFAYPIAHTEGGLLWSPLLIAVSFGWTVLASRDRRPERRADWLLAALGLLVGALVLLGANSWLLKPLGDVGFGPEAWKLVIIVPLSAALGFVAASRPKAGVLTGAVLLAASFAVQLLDRPRIHQEPGFESYTGVIQRTLSEALCTTHDLANGVSYCMEPGLARPSAWGWVAVFLLAAGVGGLVVRRRGTAGAAPVPPAGSFAPAPPAGSLAPAPPAGSFAPAPSEAQPASPWVRQRLDGDPPPADTVPTRLGR